MDNKILCFSFEFLCSLLRDPLWLKKTFTTKEHKGYHEGTQRNFQNTNPKAIQKY
jgi:hypothetical protein